MCDKSLAGAKAPGIPMPAKAGAPSAKAGAPFEYTVRYIYKNPVKAGLCKEVFQWPGSGILAGDSGSVRAVLCVIRA